MRGLRRCVRRCWKKNSVRTTSAVHVIVYFSILICNRTLLYISKLSQCATTCFTLFLDAILEVVAFHEQVSASGFTPDQTLPQMMCEEFYHCDKDLNINKKKKPKSKNKDNSKKADQSKVPSEL